MKDLSHIVTSICEEVKEIAHQLAFDTNLTLTQAEKLLRETTRDWERRLMQKCYVYHAAKPTDSVTCPICEQPMQVSVSAINGLKHCVAMC